MPAQVISGPDSKMEDAPQDDISVGRGMGGSSYADRSGDDEPRPDPDAQTTVTDFLDFTEYLPSDTMRSLTLIRNLDQSYADASIHIHKLTAQWGQLPTLPAAERPSPIRLRADISEHLDRAVSARVFAHAEAVRMSENVGRHQHKAKVLLSKLQTMMDNYPTEEEQQQQQLSPVAARSPQAARKSAAKAAGEEVPRKQPKIPKVTVPGEVLAPYDIEYDTFSDDSSISSDDDDDATPVPNRRAPGQTPRIKLFSGGRPPKSAGRSNRGSMHTGPTSEELAAHAAALLRPPPPDAVIGSADAPWLQLTEYELAKLRKRMKKNATWTPSETMVARELRALGRGPEDYRDAKRKAEEEGKTFEPATPAPVADDTTGTTHLPAGAISVDTAAADEMPTSNRGMKLNEAKKMKREALARQAAEEAEESARKTATAAKLFLGGNSNNNAGASASSSGSQKDTPSKPAAKGPRNAARPSQKRKRDSEGDAGSDAPEGAETPSARPQMKRTKTETPVPPPQLGNLNQRGATPSATTTTTTTRSQGPPTAYVETPVPLPMLQRSGSSTTRTGKSPTPSTGAVTTTTVPTKPPMTETPVPLPRQDRRKSTTPAPPTTGRRETRGDAAKRTTGWQGDGSDPLQQQQQQLSDMETERAMRRRSSSRGPNTAKSTPAPETRRPSSRGKALSQEPQLPSAAADRPRRASTARNTPAPEARPPSRRSKRPAPGIVSTTSSGGSAAVGKRKAPPRKKARTTKKEKDQSPEMEDVDDEGNPIDPEEERYCLCNRVSFGTMIRCDNDNCKQEWFHLSCVGLDNIPARTTKWYCPDCRKLLNIGGKGEVNARGVKK